MNPILEALESGDLNTFCKLVADDESLRNSPNAFGLRGFTVRAARDSFQS